MAEPNKKETAKPEPKAEPKDFLEIGGSPVPGLTLRHVLRGHAIYITRIAWSPDGSYLASPSADKTIRIWDTRIWACVRTLRGHTGQINSVAWLPDGERLASASGDNSIRLWDAASGTHLQTMKVHSASILIVAWSPDGQRLASASDDKAIRLWEAASDLVLQTLQSHTGWIYCVAWSPDGQRLASASDDKTIRLWEAASGKTLQVLEGHSASVTHTVFSSDGRWLASKSRDNTVRLWRCDNWACVAVLEERRYGDLSMWNPTPGIAFHPRLPVLATLGEGDTIIRIWGLDEALLLGASTKLSASQESVHYTTAKLVLVGDSGVGKTGLGWRLAHGEFKEHASTHGQQFWAIPQLGLKRKDGTECEAVLWDLAGQHVYRQIHSIFLDNVAAALVLFDPSNRQDPLKGTEFWLEQLKGKGQLPPAVLVGARVDRGAPALSQQQLEQFCQRYGIQGGYLSTSAKSGEGLETLLEKLKAQIPWEEMTATVTTVTFKRIKDYVLALKEKPDRKGVLVSPEELRAQLEATSTSSVADASTPPRSLDLRKRSGASSVADASTSSASTGSAAVQGSSESAVAEPVEAWTFTDAEMMTAVGHLETHGYVAILRSSAGEQHILLTPDLLASLAASIVLLADKNPRELGAVSETELLAVSDVELLQGKYPFDELKGLEKSEQQILLDAAILRFLQHNLCFRETLGNDTLLIFPGLIKQKRPLQDEFESVDDVSYIVRGRVENLYAALVVLLGYTSAFTRINQWQNQAQYEMGTGEICGFLLTEEREGELELVLYYSAAMPAYGRTLFQGLFESFLYKRDVDVTRFPPVFCANKHRIERTSVIKRVREGKDFIFCDECGRKTSLPEIEKPEMLGARGEKDVQRAEALAHLRSAYETNLTRIKGFRRDRTAPRCYVSHAEDHSAWVISLVHDLRDAGVIVLENRAQIQADDFILQICSPEYKRAWDASSGRVGEEASLIRAHLKHQRVIPLLREGNSYEASPRELTGCHGADFRDDTAYAMNLFDLVLSLYAIPLNHPAFENLRGALHRQWQETLEKRFEPRQQVFISYAWGGESEEIVNELDKAFQARGVTIVRDKRDVGFKGNIKSFMQDLGEGKAVVLVISEKYLKSPNCCFELVQIAKHGDFADRIFPIIFADAKIYDPADRLRFVEHWEKKKDELDEVMKRVSAANMEGFREDIDLYAEIRALLPKLIDVLKNMNTLTPELHQQSGFSEIFNAVMAKLEE